MPRRTWQFDSRALGFTLLTLMLSLQASYAAPLLLLAQNRQDDRDRVSLQQDRQRAERNLSDTEYLTRELASLRIALREVATRDYVRAELRSLLEDMLEAQEELRTHDPSAGVHESPRDKVKEKLKERRDKQRSPRTQQIPRVKADSRNDSKPAKKSDTAPDALQGAGPDTAGAPAHPAIPRELSLHRMNPTQDSTTQGTSPASPLEEAVHAALATVIDPELRRPITELGMVDAVEVSDGGRVRVAVLLTIAGCPLRGTITADCEAALSAVPGVTGVDVELKVMTQEQRDALKEQLRGAGGQRGIPFNDPGSLTKVYAVASGKGGVGKSSVTVNLACALAAQGLRVGIVDADVYGFSVPALMGITQAPTRVDDMILPPVAYGVKVISIGMFVTGNQPVAWRGPMLHRALEQFLTDVYFGDLDALFLDLPPGTGDIAISVAQLLPKAQILVVTTPQAAAADVAERAGAIATQTGQSVAGVVENMSYLEMPDGGRMELFGSGGGAVLAERLSATVGTDVPLLGQIPLDILLREGGDAGVPLVLGRPETPAAVALLDIAGKLASVPRGLRGMSAGPAAPLGRFGVEGRRLAVREPLDHPGRPAFRGRGGSSHGGCRGRGAGADRLGVIVEQRFLDDPARIVLPGIVLLPVDVIDIDADFFLDLLPRPGRHPADFLDDVGKFLGVFGQPAGTNHQKADDQQK